MSTPAAIRFSSIAVLPALALAFTAGALAQTAAPAKPAANAQPSIPLTPFTAADQSASAGVPAGWKVTQSGGTEITMTGPQGETVLLGFEIFAHSGVFQPGQKAPAPASLSMPSSATLTQKLAMLTQWGTAAQGRPNPQFVVASATPVQVPPVLGQCGKFVFSFTGKTAQGQVAPLKAMAFYCSLPVDAAGFYKNILIQAQAPVATAAQSAPTALAIFGSYKISPAWLQKVIAPLLNPQDQSAINGQAQRTVNSFTSQTLNNQIANTIMNTTNNQISGAIQSENCADSVIRQTPNIFLPQSCGGPWPSPQ